MSHLKLFLLSIIILIFFSGKDIIAELSNYDDKKLLIGDVLNSESGIFGISDSWFMRNLIFRQSPYNALTVKYNNVVLNNVSDGSFRGDLLFLNSSSEVSFHGHSDIYSNSESLSGTVNITNKMTDSTNLVTIIEGGNIFGSTSFDYTRVKNYVKFNAGVNYITSGNFDVSQNKPENVNLTRNNSSFDKVSANGRLGVSDNKSLLDAEFIYSQSWQNFPVNTNINQQFFLDEPDYKLNLFNLMFATKVNSNYEISGNIFYLRTKSIFESFDNAEFQTMNLPSSFVKSFEESRFGWNSKLEFNLDNIPPGNLTLNYSRETLKYQGNSGLPVNRYELEKLNLGFEIHDKLELWDYSIGLNYRIINPLTTYQDEFFSSYSNVDYFFIFGINLTKKMAVRAALSRSSMLPQMYLIYSDINHGGLFRGIDETTANFNLETGIVINPLNKTSLSINYFNNQFSNVHVPFALLDNHTELTDNNMSSHGFNFNINSDIGLAHVGILSQFFLTKENVFDNFGRELIVPDLMINLRLFNYYEFGFSWLVESTFISGRESFSNDKNLQDFAIFNIRLSQELFNKNELFLRVNNLTNIYYEYFSGMPMPGINFIAGIKIII